MKIYNRNNKYNPEIHHRYSSRLQGYDYSQNGAYFVTICTRKKEPLFNDKNMKLIIEQTWLETPAKRPDVFLDEYVVMPNHFHGIIIINSPVGAYSHTPLQPIFRSPSRTIGAIIRGFKASSTLKINIYRKTPRVPVWQRNYYEHVIRNDNDLHDSRQYIRENPLRWDADEYHLEI